MPTALLYFQNRQAIASPAPFIEVLAGAAIASALAVVVLGRRVAPHISGGIVGASGYGFFSMSWLPSGGPTASMLLIWLLLSIVSSALVVWLLSNSRAIVTAAGMLAGSLAIGLTVAASLDHSGSEQSITARPVPEAMSFSETPERTPNVYVFVLDGFANPDVTAEQFANHGIDFDLDQPIAELESLGFIRDERASANYGQTILSMPSTLNADYPRTPDADFDGAELVSTLRGNNTLVNTLRSIGYDFWFSSSGLWDPSSCDLLIADSCIGTAANDAEAKRAIWIETPLRNIVGVPRLADLPDPVSVVDEILAEADAQIVETPYVAVAHIISPHQPYRYEPDCTLRNDGAPGTDLNYGGEDTNRPRYAVQANCLADLLVDAMTDLREADPEGLIFLQADHGSEFEADRETVNWPDAMARERLGIFRMTHLPNECRSADPAAQSIINTVPMIIACLRGEEPELLVPRYFFVNFSNEAEILEASPETFWPTGN